MSEKTTSRAAKRPSSRRQSYSERIGKKIRLKKLTMKNFKAFESFTIEFPPPRMKGDPDILVMGSSNGLGKTSVLEACSLLCYAATMGPRTLDIKRYSEVKINLSDLLIRSGAEKTEIEGTFIVGEEQVDVHLSLDRSRTMVISGGEVLHRLFSKAGVSLSYASETIVRFLGLNTNPFFLPPLIYFHSYRKVQEGSLELGRLVEGERYRSSSDVPMSTFKLEILRALMSREGLFEDFDVTEARDVLEKLDELIKQYANVSLGKLRLDVDNSIDIRVLPNGTDGSLSYTFDGLSSGQKEIISTLFLIWRNTQEQPGIVLIDEPELHLNAEWHWEVIKHLHQLAPNNQYIIATHSEDIASAVDKGRRILLVPDGEKY